MIFAVSTSLHSTTLKSGMTSHLNYQKTVTSLALKKEFTFSHLCDAVKALRIRDKLDMDELYEEY